MLYIFIGVQRGGVSVNGNKRGQLVVAGKTSHACPAVDLARHRGCAATGKDNCGRHLVTHLHFCARSVGDRPLGMSVSELSQCSKSKNCTHIHQVVERNCLKKRVEKRIPQYKCWHQPIQHRRLRIVPCLLSKQPGTGLVDEVRRRPSASLASLNP